jgi:UDP-N-acetylglucosamine:LPS N-acetylglucosamine transferase
MLLLNEHRRRRQMATKVRLLAHPDALTQIAAMVLKLAQK